MKYLLPRLMATLTQHPREIVRTGVDFKWNPKCWTFNTFRFYELIFGRKGGIRFEGVTLPNEYGEMCHVFGTVENFLVFCEGAIRAYFKTWEFGFRIIPVPVWATEGGGMRTPFLFAIAYVTAADHGDFGNVNTGTITVTGSGSNTFILSWSGGTIGGAPTVTSVTYNSVNLASVNSVNVPSDRWWSMWCLPGAATGSNNLTVNQSAMSDLFIGGMYYSGCAQTGQPDNSNNATQSGGAAITGSVTVNSANCWIAYCASLRGSMSTLVSPGTARINDGNMQLCDSNGTVSTGSNTCVITANLTGSSAGMVMMSIEPVAGTTVVPLLSLMGVGV